MPGFRFINSVFLLLLTITSTDAFSVISSKPQTSQRSSMIVSPMVLQMAATSTPPPPPPSSPAEQVRVSSVSSTTSTVTAPVPAATNLPSQQELSQKAKDVKAPATPSAAATVTSAKSNNVASSTAAGGLTISSINFDGKVPKTESDEYVVITNKASNTMDISGYYIYVATTGTQGPTFYFPKGAVIKPNQSLRIYTNEIHPETGGYSYGSGKAIWSNNGGLAVLKDDKGKKLMEYKYKPSA